MRESKTDRGFQFVGHRTHVGDSEGRTRETRLVQESTAVLDYDDALETPGSSALWIGPDHHLNREEVARLVEYLDHWLKTGRLFPE